MAETLLYFEEDRLTSLPDTLLVEILSLIPFKSAVATSVLSHRWCHLWTQLPHIILDEPWPHVAHSQVFHQFITTVDHILQQITSPHIRSFHLHIPYPPIVENNELEVCSASLKSWISLICARNVVKLKVSCDFPAYLEPHVPLPSCIFETESLVELHLGGNLCCKLPETINLANLKKIVLIDLPIACYVFKTLFKSCPLLEILSLELDSESASLQVLDISAQYLKSLIILGKSRHFIFMIDAPMLEHIEIHGFLGHYMFVKCPSRLFKAGIDIWNFSYSRTDYLRYIPKLIKGISSVKSLYLLNGLAVFNALSSLDVDVGSVIIPNLIHLSMDMSRNEVDWGDSNPIPMCLLSQLKTIKLLNIKGDAADAKLVEYILSKENVMERLYVSSMYDGYEKDQLWTEYKLRRTLLLLVPRISKIEFIGGYIRLSSDMPQNGFIVQVSV